MLGLCREAGLVSVGVITIDGTKIKANASMDQNRSYRELVEPDPARGRGDRPARGRALRRRRVVMSCPSSCAPRRAAGQALAEAKRRIEERKGRAVSDDGDGRELEVDPEWVLGRGGRRGGRREWPRVARRELEAHRERQAQPIPRDREDRLFQALGRLEDNHRVDLAANEAYERWRATARDTQGTRC